MDGHKSLHLPPCGICSAQATGFHYGLNTCEACKTFFSRSLTKHQFYECPYMESCTISNENRRSCAYCRYQKCLKLGMRKEASKTGRYSHEQRASNIRELRKLQPQTAISLDNSCTKPKNSSIDLNDTQVNSASYVSKVTDCSLDNSKTNTPSGQPNKKSRVQDILSDINENDKALDINCLMQSLAVDNVIENQRTLYSLSKVEQYERVTQNLIRVSKALSYRDEKPFEVLSELEKEYLELIDLKQQVFGAMKPMTTEEYVQFYKETGIDIDGRRQLLETNVLPRMEEAIKQLVLFVKAIPGFTSLCLSDRIGLIKSSRFDVYLLAKHRNFKIQHKVFSPTPGVVLHVEDLMKVRGSIVDPVRRVLKRMQKLNLKEDETVIVCALAVMCADNCILLDRFIVERSQEFLLECLFFLFDKHCYQEKLRFFRIVNLLTELRTVREEHNRSDEEMANMWWGIVNFPPIVSSLFASPEASDSPNYQCWIRKT